MRIKGLHFFPLETAPPISTGCAWYYNSTSLSCNTRCNLWTRVMLFLKLISSDIGKPKIHLYIYTLVYLSSREIVLVVIFVLGPL